MLLISNLSQKFMLVTLLKSCQLYKVWSTNWGNDYNLFLFMSCLFVSLHSLSSKTAFFFITRPEKFTSSKLKWTVCVCRTGVTDLTWSGYDNIVKSFIIKSITNLWFVRYCWLYTSYCRFTSLTMGKWTMLLITCLLTDIEFSLKKHTGVQHKILYCVLIIYQYIRLKNHKQ